jgi:Helix-turn-helix domain
MLDTECFGEWLMSKCSKCTCSASPFISTSCAWKSLQTFSNMTLSRWMASPSNTCLRYFVTKTKWTCNAKTQCLPRRISFANRVDQEYNPLRLQACKFALRPNGEQIRNLRQFAGSCRFVYNKALALNVERHEKKKKRLGFAGLCALLPNWKNGARVSVCRASASIAASVKESRTGVHKFLSKASRLPQV